MYYNIYQENAPHTGTLTFFAVIFDWDVRNTCRYNISRTEGFADVQTLLDEMEQKGLELWTPFLHSTSQSTAEPLKTPLIVDTGSASTERWETVAETL